MKTRIALLVVMIAGFVVVFSHTAQTQSPVALTGLVTSKDEAHMEGVLVSAKKAGSTMTLTVVSDEQGRYRFPASKLEPGKYGLRIRAVGYDLDGPPEVDVTSGQTTTADLRLTTAHDLAEIGRAHV